MGSGTILIGYDGTAAAEHALREGAELLRSRPALVVVVWKAGLAFELLELPASSIGIPPAPLDLRTAIEVDRSLYEGAQRAAHRAAELARTLGLDADGIAVADDPETPVAETLVALAQEHDARTIVVGAHAHSDLLGSTTRGVVRHARCPVLVVRETGA